MPNELWQYIQSRSATDLVRDVLDVLITYYVFYRVALVLKGTRAMQILLGIAGVFVLYVVAELLRLHTVLTLLTAVLSSAILIVVVVFQNDIRRGLMRMGGRAGLSTGQTVEGKLIDDVVEAAQILAKHRTGAIITLEQEANLDEFVGSHQGHVIDATVTPELLVSMFIPEAMNKLHDGAVVIRDLRIAKAGVFFPMPEGRVADESFGSRHRAAMGITEETDAVVVVVSEERGSISFCFNGNIIPNLDGPRLRAALDGVFGPKRTVTRKATSLFSIFRRRPTETPRSARASTPPRTTRTPLRRKIQENSTSSLRAAEGRKGQPQVGAGSSLEPLRKRPKTPEQPSVSLDPPPEQSVHEATATATPLRVRQLPPPPEDDRVSLLEESSFQSAIPRDSLPRKLRDSVPPAPAVPNLPREVLPRKVRDSVPPAAPVPNLARELPPGPSDVPLRHITRGASSPSKEDVSPPRNEPKNEIKAEPRNESRGPSHEDTLRSMSSPARALTPDESAEGAALPNLSLPLPTPTETPDHESAARDRAEPTA